MNILENFVKSIVQEVQKTTVIKPTAEPKVNPVVKPTFSLVVVPVDKAAPKKAANDQNKEIPEVYLRFLKKDNREYCSQMDDDEKNDCVNLRVACVDYESGVWEASKGCGMREAICCVGVVDSSE